LICPDLRATDRSASRFPEQLRQRGVGHCEYVTSPFLRASSKRTPESSPFFYFQAAYRLRAESLPAAALDFRLASVVKIGERDGGHSHAIAGAIGEEGFQKTSTSKARVGAIKFLVESADEDNTPETFDGAFRLAAAAEPFEHGDAAVFLQVDGLPLVRRISSKAARDGKLVQQRQRPEGRERSGQMNGAAKTRRASLLGAPAVEKEETVEELDLPAAPMRV